MILIQYWPYPQYLGKIAKNASSAALESSRIYLNGERALRSVSWQRRQNRKQTSLQREYRELANEGPSFTIS